MTAGLTNIGHVASLLIRASHGAAQSVVTSAVRPVSLGGGGWGTRAGSGSRTRAGSRSRTWPRSRSHTVARSSTDGVKVTDTVEVTQGQGQCPVRLVSMSHKTMFNLTNIGGVKVKYGRAQGHARSVSMSRNIGTAKVMYGRGQGQLWMGVKVTNTDGIMVMYAVRAGSRYRTWPVTRSRSTGGVEVTNTSEVTVKYGRSHGQSDSRSNMAGSLVSRANMATIKVTYDQAQAQHSPSKGQTWMVSGQTWPVSMSNDILYSQILQQKSKYIETQIEIHTNAILMSENNGKHLFIIIYF